MMIKTIHRILSSAVSKYELDWRSCYTQVRSEPPGGRAVTVECSDRRVLDDIRDSLGGELRGPEGRVAIRLVMLPDEDAHLPERFAVVTSVADLRKEPSHASELLTQAIAGEGLAPLKRDGDWVLVRMDDGYLGWVRSWCIKPMSALELENFVAGAAHRVCGNVIQILDRPGEEGGPVCDAVSGTRLASTPCGRRGWRAVRFADGREGYARSRWIERVPAARRRSRKTLGETGRRFLGVPYVWGGTTAKGFDCSGLVQHVFRLHGMLLPRDSDQQSRFGREKPIGDVDALNTGDLLFFGKSDAQITHVALYLSNGLFLHAHGEVRENALNLRHPLYAEKLVGEWRCVRDPLNL